MVMARIERRNDWMARAWFSIGVVYGVVTILDGRR